MSNFGSYHPRSLQFSLRQGHVFLSRFEGAYSYDNYICPSYNIDVLPQMQHMTSSFFCFVLFFKSGGDILYPCLLTLTAKINRLAFRFSFVFIKFDAN